MRLSSTRRFLSIAAALSSGLLLLAGCAGRETTVRSYILPPQSVRTWIGVSVDEVVKRWGDPAERAPDGEGGTILTYKSDPKVEFSASRGPTHDANSSPGVDGMGYPPGLENNMEVLTLPTANAVFYISAKGVVYRYAISPKLLAGGKVPLAPLPEHSED
jgi:hypothetical protein